MNALSTLYSRVLGLGLLFVREAIRSQDFEWAEAEVELLQNVPSLFDEPNLDRHRYFWFKERESYIQWINASGRTAAQSHMRTFYEPVWREMEPNLLELFSCDRPAALVLVGNGVKTETGRAEPVLG